MNNPFLKLFEYLSFDLIFGENMFQNLQDKNTLEFIEQSLKALNLKGMVLLKETFNSDSKFKRKIIFNNFTFVNLFLIKTPKIIIQQILSI